MITLRLLDTGDAAQWLDLQRETYASDLEEYGDCPGHPAADTLDMIIARMEAPCCHHYLADRDGAAVGGIRINWTQDRYEYEIGDLFVPPRFQNAGCGKAIVRAAESLYPDAVRWKLWTEPESPRNHYFYESLGYTKTEEHLVLEGGETLVLFRKEK